MKNQNWRTRILTVALTATSAAAASGVLLAQAAAPAASQTQTTRTTMQQNPDGSTTMNTTTTTITGDVVSYEPGKTIVVRDPNRGPITYTIGPSLTVPADVQVGRKVTITSDPVDGSLRVSRITTVTSTSASAPAANPAELSTTTTETTQMNPPAGSDTTTQTTKTTRMTTVAGTVQAYEPGQSITIVGPGTRTTTYVVTSDSRLPQDIAVGKVVSVQTSVVSGKPVAQVVTYKTTTKTTHTKSISPK